MPGDGSKRKDACRTARQAYGRAAPGLRDNRCRPGQDAADKSSRVHRRVHGGILVRRERRENRRITNNIIINRQYETGVEARRTAGNCGRDPRGGNAEINHAGDGRRDTRRSYRSRGRGGGNPRRDTEGTRKGACKHPRQRGAYSLLYRRNRLCGYIYHEKLSGGKYAEERNQGERRRHCGV